MIAGLTMSSERAAHCIGTLPDFVHPYFYIALKLNLPLYICDLPPHGTLKSEIGLRKMGQPVDVLTRTMFNTEQQP